MNDAFLMYY